MDVRSKVANAILESTADAIVAADAHGIIRFWNPAAQRLFGYAEAEALGQSLDLIIPSALRERHWGGYRQVIATGRSRYSESALLSVPALRRDGTRLSVEFTIVPLKAPDGRITDLIAVMRDVTERFEQIRALRQRLSEKAS